jgi:hypothetical protein
MRLVPEGRTEPEGLALDGVVKGRAVAEEVRQEDAGAAEQLVSAAEGGEPPDAEDVDGEAGKGAGEQPVPGYRQPEHLVPHGILATACVHTCPGLGRPPAHVLIVVVGVDVGGCICAHAAAGQLPYLLQVLG